MKKGKVVEFPACVSAQGVYQRHQFAAFRGPCLRCGRERDPQRCPCGAMSIEAAKERGHQCPRAAREAAVRAIMSDPEKANRLHEALVQRSQEFHKPAA